MKLHGALLLLCATGAWAQAPRWRYTEFPMYGDYEAFPMSMSESGSIGVILRSPVFPNPAWRGALYAAGNGYTVAPMVTRPNGTQVPYYPRVFNANGGTVCTVFDQFATWTPGGSVVLGATGAIGDHEFYNTSGQGILVTTPRHPLEPRLWGFSTSISGPVYGIVGSGAEPTEVNDFNNQGIAVGKVWYAPTNAEQPAVWTNEGRTISYLTSPGQIAGRALGIDHSGNVFGLVAKQGSQPGWYGTWWDSTGAVTRQVYFYRLDPFNPTFDPASNYNRNSAMAADGSVVYTDFDGTSAYRPKYYSPMTGIVDINSQIEGLPAGARLLGVRGMSDGKRMFGAIYNPTVGLATYNFYLEPVPEPASLGALAVGLFALMKRRKPRR